MKCEDALNQPKPADPQLPIVLVAAAALIKPSKEVLIAQRPQGKAMAGLWEFPGGKVDAGETPEYALMRELEEELGIETRPCCFHPIAFASHAYEKFHLLMPLFACRVWRGEVKMNEHQAFKWVRPVDMLDYPMPEADIPLVTALRDLL
jgi:8-oxo-dGTP diphosphatase